MRAVHVIVAAAVLAAVAGAACKTEPAAPPPPPYQTNLGVQPLMRHVVEPAADTVWLSVSTTITEKGVEEKFPQNDEEWEAVRHGAAVLVESGNLLMMPGRARDQEDWIKFSSELTAAANNSLKAALSKDVEGVFKTSGEVYQACTNCHAKYWADDPRGQLNSSN